MRVLAASTRDKPVYINGNPYTGTFIRRNEGDYRCTKQEVDRMIRDASAESADSAILKGYSWKDLDADTFARYRQHYRQFNPSSPWNSYDDMRFFKSLGGYRRDPETNQEGITRAAILMFGSREAILNLRPRHLVDFRVIPAGGENAEQRWEHRIAWEGNLYDAFFQIYPRLIEPLKTPFKLEGPHRLTETKAHEALRESLVNMLAHADYAESAALLVKASSQEFVFRNPGSSRISEEDLWTGDRSDPRNPILLRMFRHVSLAEEAGTGLPKIRQIWREAGLQFPSLTSDTERYEFTLTLRLVHLLSQEDRVWLAECANFRPPTGQTPLPGIAPLTEDEQLTLIHARNQGSVNNASVQAFTGLHRADVTELLTNLRKRGLLDQISSRRWASYKLPEALQIAYISARETYKHKPVSKIYKERLRTQILDFCRIPRRADEIATETGKNRIYLVTHYLTPLVKEGCLRYTNPAHPAARNQKYVTKPTGSTNQ
jgi:predicted HTH transcriptional regulator